MMFAHRFTESFNVRERKAIANGTIDSIAPNSKISGPTRIPSISPSIIFSNTPGSVNINNEYVSVANALNIHSTEIFILQSSKTVAYPRLAQSIFFV